MPVVSLRAKLTSFLSLSSITSKILMARTQVAVFIAILVILSAFSPEVTAASCDQRSCIGACNRSTAAIQVRPSEYDRVGCRK